MAMSLHIRAVDRHVMFADNGRIKLSMTFYNGSYKIKTLYFRLQSVIGTDVYTVKNFTHDATVAANAALQITDKIINSLTPLEQMPSRAGTMRILLYKVEDSAGTDHSVNVTATSSETVTIVDKHYTPTMEPLQIERVDSGGTAADDGEHIALTTTIADTVEAPSGQFSCALYYKAGTTVSAADCDGTVDLTASLSALKAGQRVVLSAPTFSNGTNWAFLLKYGDAYESANGLTSIARAFANVHLSGASTGGVAFGKFSASTEDNPLFECEYPAVFGAGVTVNPEALLKVVSVTASGSVSVSDPNLTATLAVGAGDGWTPIGIVGYYASNAALHPYRMAVNGANAVIAARYHGNQTTATSVTVRVDVLCLHTPASS